MSRRAPPRPAGMSVMPGQHGSHSRATAVKRHLECLSLSLSILSVYLSIGSSDIVISMSSSSQWRTARPLSEQAPGRGSTHLHRDQPAFRGACAWTHGPRVI
ncbi:hypothetical protein VTN00DRAFT_9006 [Thermoascus crustaceus]|uniref:uncharacterized protein n=1 Tax=Thermoascus crustaceus TaxID=5088 RepID=UPI00374446C9